MKILLVLPILTVVLRCNIKKIYLEHFGLWLISLRAEGRQTSPSWRRGRKRDGPAAPLPPSHTPHPLRYLIGHGGRVRSWGEGSCSKNTRKALALPATGLGQFCPAPGTLKLMWVAVLAPLEFRGLLPDLMPPSAHPMLILRSQITHPFPPQGAIPRKIQESLRPFP